MRRKRLWIALGIGALALLTLSGVAIANASGADDGAPLTRPTADRAGAAALAIFGGGTVTGLERDGEKGATFEVEVTRDDGSQVDVRLDAAFQLVVVDGDSEGSGDSGR